MMSSDILLLVLHKNYCCTWKYILKLIFKGFFLINRCLIFKVRRTRFVSAWILYHTAPQLSTLFFAFFIRFFQLLRVFCKRMDFVMVLMHCYGGSVLLRLVFYWVIGLLLFYYYIFGFVVFTFLSRLRRSRVGAEPGTMWASSPTGGVMISCVFKQVNAGSSNRAIDFLMFLRTAARAVPTICFFNL